MLMDIEGENENVMKIYGNGTQWKCDKIGYGNM